MQGGKMIRSCGFVYRGKHTCRCDFCLLNNRQEQAGDLPNTKAVSDTEHVSLEDECWDLL